MSYLIFARKFRPQNFEEMIGQVPITTTLQNAIRQERIPQSFLFAGPRGVGKTSAARILAKALNCVKGPTDKPCNQCTNCLEITEGRSLDVLEIDGASNRGIEEIRNLRETVKFKPAQGRFKVYIIDEVHMLTTEAFNALLKTLEEPPEHVKFVFATTEAHKVPLTILSRCQRFNFKRIPVADIVKKLEEIAKEEKIKCEKTAFFLIAKASDGALRDAESLLDQLATFSKDKVKEEDVLFLLGHASEAVYFSVLAALNAKDGQKVFSLVRELYDGGVDLVYFSRGLLEIFRNLLVLHCAAKGEEFVEMSEGGMEALKKHKDDFSRGELLLALSLLQNLQGQLRRNLAPPKLLVETVLLKLLHLEGFKPVGEMISDSVKRGPVSGTDDFSSRPGASGGSFVPPQNPGIVAPKRKTDGPPLSSAAVGETVQPENHLMTLNEAESIWPRVVEYVKSKRMSIGIFLSESEPIEISDGAIILGLPAEFQFHKETLEKNPNQRLVEEAFEVISGKKVRLQFVITQPPSEENSLDAPREDAGVKLPEIINEALNIFEGAKVIRKE